MSDIHAGPDTHSPGDGLCTWHHEYGGVRLRCDENVVPGSRSCAEHLIARHAPRRFRQRVIRIEDATT